MTRETDVNRDELRAQLGILIDTLRCRSGEVFIGPPTHDPGQLAARWADTLLDCDNMDAVQVGEVILNSLLDPSRAETPEFWRSPLGGALVGVGVLPASVSRPVAGAILGVSRQRVAELIQLGRLKAADPGVTRESVLERLAKR